MRGEMIYPQVMIQSYLRGWDNRILAEKSGIPYTSLRRKMRGTSELTLKEAMKIQQALNCGMSLDALFELRREKVA